MEILLILLLSVILVGLGLLKSFLWFLLFSMVFSLEIFLLAIKILVFVLNFLFSLEFREEIFSFCLLGPVLLNDKQKKILNLLLAKLVFSAYSWREFKELEISSMKLLIKDLEASGMREKKVLRELITLVNMVEKCWEKGLKPSEIAVFLFKLEKLLILGNLGTSLRDFNKWEAGTSLGMTTAVGRYKHFEMNYGTDWFVLAMLGVDESLTTWIDIEDNIIDPKDRVVGSADGKLAQKRRSVEWQRNMTLNRYCKTDNLSLLPERLGRLITSDLIQSTSQLAGISTTIKDKELKNPSIMRAMEKLTEPDAIRSFLEESPENWTFLEDINPNSKVLKFLQEKREKLLVFNNHCKIKDGKLVLVKSPEYFIIKYEAGQAIALTFVDSEYFLVLLPNEQPPSEFYACALVSENCIVKDLSWKKKMDQGVVITNIRENQADQSPLQNLNFVNLYSSLLDSKDYWGIRKSDNPQEIIQKLLEDLNIEVSGPLSENKVLSSFMRDDTKF